MDKEQYKRTFNVIKPKTGFTWDEHLATKKVTKHPVSKQALAICVALIAVICGSSIAYAANIGGFRDVVNIWIGDRYVESSIEESGKGQFTVTTPDGNSFIAGGVSDDGEPVTGEDVIEYLEGPDVFRDDNGRIWFYDKDYRQDITEDIADGETRIIREYGDREKYIVITIAEDGCIQMAFSNKSFEDAMR